MYSSDVAPLTFTNPPHTSPTARDIFVSCSLCIVRASNFYPTSEIGGCDDRRTGLGTFCFRSQRGLHSLGLIGSPTRFASNTRRRCPSQLADTQGERCNRQRIRHCLTSAQSTYHTSARSSCALLRVHVNVETRVRHPSPSLAEVICPASRQMSQVARSPSCDLASRTANEEEGRRLLVGPTVNHRLKFSFAAALGWLGRGRLMGWNNRQRISHVCSPHPALRAP